MGHHSNLANRKTTTMNRLLTILFSCIILVTSTNAFTVSSPRTTTISSSSFSSMTSTTSLNIFGNKKTDDDFDISSIESRDLTREEMLEINKQNEEIMNMELQMMTGFSLVLSLPILYLCWVAFFSD